ncbi:hypothetical protein [Enterocloster hominis (ex Hitch et al. 2024)]|uniref:Uncharacterized protein n=1 Tax=Enterocloster hominis (ex Hitch et al. 2024) TaxID=1917870 RepID=A0ABV1DDQ5_9FIRM
MNWLAPGGGDYLRHGNGGDGSLPPGVFLSDILCPVSFVRYLLIRYPVNPGFLISPAFHSVICREERLP